MPSVRIKRHRYSTLNDQDGAAESSRALSNIFRRSQSPIGINQEGQSSTSPTVDSPQAINSPTVCGSRIHQSCITQGNASRSIQRDRQSASELSRSSASPIHYNAPGDHVVTLEGQTANIQVHSNGEPGLLGSALSLHSDEASYDSYSPLDDHHHDDVIDHLDVIDPQVATISNLTNAANSILFPPLSWYSRKPVVNLGPPLVSEGDMEGGEREYDDSLDQHVNDVLKRPSKVKRTLRGIWSFLKTPMGIITGIYGFLVVFWGAAIVVFLIKIINFHNDDLQGFWIEVSSQVTNGLFTVTGIGLIPSRVLDTYRIYKIWHYKRKTRQLRNKAGLPPLFDEDDLPDPAYDPNYVHVLTEREQNDLHREQRKFKHHQTWYRPHGTATHRAFPINTALLICLLNDGNSIFQIILCGCMWGMNRFQRPAWTTGTLIPASFLCGIGSAVFIGRGSTKTKRIKEVEKRLRDALALEHPETMPGDDKALKQRGREWAGGSVIEAPSAAGCNSEKRAQTPDAVIDEHMSINAAAAAAEKRKISSERGRSS